MGTCLMTGCEKTVEPGQSHCWKCQSDVSGYRRRNRKEVDLPSAEELRGIMERGAENAFGKTDVVQLALQHANKGRGEIVLPGRYANLNLEELGFQVRECSIQSGFSGDINRVTVIRWVDR